MATAGDDNPPYMKTFNDVVILAPNAGCPIVRNLRDDINGSYKDGRRLKAEFVEEATWDTNLMYDIDEAIDNSVVVVAFMAKEFVTDRGVLLKYCSALGSKLEHDGRGNIKIIPVYTPSKKQVTYVKDLKGFLKTYIHLDYDPDDPQYFLDKLWRTLQSHDSEFRREAIISRLELDYVRLENEKRERRQKQSAAQAQEKARHEQQMEVIADKSGKLSFVDTQVRGEHTSMDDVVEDTNSGGKLVEDSRQERSMSIEQPGFGIPPHMGDSTGHVVPMDHTSSLLTSDLDLRSDPPTSAIPRIPTQNNGDDSPVTPPSQANTDDHSMIQATSSHRIQTGGPRSVPDVNSPCSIDIGAEASEVSAGEHLAAGILHSFAATSGGNSLERQTAAAVASEADAELLASDSANQTIPRDDSSEETLCKEIENMSLHGPEHESHVLDGARSHDSAAAPYPQVCTEDPVGNPLTSRPDGSQSVTPEASPIEDTPLESVPATYTITIDRSSISGSPSPVQEPDPVFSLGIRFPDEQRE